MRTINVVTAVIGVLTLLFMLELLRRRQLREKYAVLWLAVALAVLLLGVFPGLLDGVADTLGVYDPPNLLLFVAVVVLLLVCVHLSWEVSRLEDETRVLAEEVALLNFEVSRLSPDASGSGTGGGATPPSE